MNNTEIAKTIGKSRQMLEATVCGRRNLGYHSAKKAVQIFGGTTDIWQDKSYTQMRMQLFAAFKEKAGGGK